MRVLVAFVDDQGHSEAPGSEGGEGSEASEPVSARVTCSPATGAPTTGGTAQVGETLTAGTSPPTIRTG